MTDNIRRIVIAAAASFAVSVGTTAAAQDAKVQKGMQVFAAQKCSQCHSIAGKGNAKGKLDAVAGELSPAQIKEWIVDPVGMAAKNNKNRKPPMKKKAIPDADIDALVAYLSTLK